MQRSAPWVVKTKLQAPQALKDNGPYVWISSEENTEPVLDRGISGVFFGPSAESKWLDQITSLIENGALKTYVEEVFSLENAALAQEKIAAGRVTGKIAIAIE